MLCIYIYVKCMYNGIYVFIMICVYIMVYIYIYIYMMIYVHFKIAVCSWHKHLLHIMPHFTYCTYKSYTQYIRSYDFVPNKLALKPSGLSSCSSFQWWFCPNAYFLKGWRPQNMATPKDLWLWPGKNHGVWCAKWPGWWIHGEALMTWSPMDD